jgi:hypothetical protein
MQDYNPRYAPNPAEWLAIQESERIDMVLFFHDEVEDELPEDGKTLHSLIHVVVENQIALGVEPVGNAIARLSRQGLSRHEAIHAVGAVLSEDIYDLMQNGQEAFNKTRYRRQLEKLTAKRWKKGQW